MWNLRNSNNELLHPRRYSNGKTQEAVIEEILNLLDENDIVCLLGGVGTGKSPIALHIIAHYGKGIISTPTKVLEKQ